MRAGLVSSTKEWLWSSYKERTGENSWLLINEIPVGLPKGWGRYVDEPLREKELNRLQQSVSRQSPSISLWNTDVVDESEQRTWIRIYP